MRQKSSQRLFDYWNNIRGKRAAPRREEIEPSDIRELLADTFILEVSGSMRTVSYRLAGTRLCAAFGRELKGYGFLGHWNEEDCFDVAKLLARVYRDMEPLIAVMRGHTQSGKTVDYEFVLLPLEPMIDGTARILGVATPSKDFYWLGAEPITDCRLRSARVVEREASIVSNAPPLSPSLQSVSELPGEGVPVSDRDLPSHTTRRVAHLVVHDGGRD